MAAGITSFGAYIPMYRMSMETLFQMWGGWPRPGEKAVANYDEDTLTMAVEAATDCLTGIDHGSVDNLYFASVTPVYREKQTASIMAKVLNMRRDAITMDVANSMRGATLAMRSAMDAINAGSAKNALVVATDCRIPPPNSDFERLFGDGAAALLFGNSDLAVEIEGNYSISSEFMDIWRNEDDALPQTWEDRFVITKGYIEHMQETVSGLLKKYNLTPKDFDKVVLYAWDARRHRELAKKLGFDFDTQVQDSLLLSIGHTGTASAMMMLIAALEEAKPGDRILFANYGDGADAYILRATELIEKVKDRRGVKKHLVSKAMIPSYGKYLTFRNMMQWEVQREPPPYAALTMSWRDRDMILTCEGQKCRHCDTVQFPKQRVCTWCQAKDEFDDVLLADKRGTVFTYSLDYLTTVTPDPPNIIAVINLDGGGRMYTTMTDRDPEKLTPDMRVEFTFRKLHDSQGMHNYFWRCRPIRV